MSPRLGLLGLVLLLPACTSHYEAFQACTAELGPLPVAFSPLMVFGAVGGVLAAETAPAPAGYASRDAYYAAHDECVARKMAAAGAPQ